MVIFDFIIGVLAALATWIQFLSFGHDAWRLFATWVALVAAIYYILDATITLLAKRRSAGAEVCPMLQGGLIVSGITLVLIRIVGCAMDSYIPSASSNVVLSEFILPVLMIMSWVMFSQKGKWRAHDPFYWLAFPGIYASATLVSGEFMSRTARLVYPYEFLNYPSIGIDTMLWWFAIFAVVILIVGYVFWILDFALSGKLSEHIVMPKIKIVVIEEEVEDDAPEPEVVEKPEEKPVKLVTTGSRNLPVIKAQAAKKSQPQSAKPNPNRQDNAKPSGVKSAKSSTKSKTAGDVKTPEKPSSAEKPNNPEKPSSAEKPSQSTSTPPVRIIEKIDISDTKPAPKTQPKTDDKKSEKTDKADKTDKIEESQPKSSQDSAKDDQKSEKPQA